MIDRPYYRMIRPGVPTEYVVDFKYADDLMEQCNRFIDIENDIRLILHKEGASAESLGHATKKTYSVWRSACISFELSSEAVLKANGYPKRRRFTLDDYRALCIPCRLGEYEAVAQTFEPRMAVRPFAGWDVGDPPGWYADRQSATLGDAVVAAGAALILLYTQFGDKAFEFIKPHAELDRYGYQAGDGVFTRESIFKVRIPLTWTKDEYYCFDWEAIKKLPDRFRKFDFGDV